MRLGANMKQILCYLLEQENYPRSGVRHSYWIKNEIARHYTEIVREAFKEEVTNNSRNRICSSCKRLFNYGLITDRYGQTRESVYGKRARYWKLTEEGRSFAQNHCS